MRNTTTRRIIGLVGGLAAASLLLAGCGTDGGDSAAGTSTPAATLSDAAGGTSPTTAPSARTSAGASASSAAASSSAKAQAGAVTVQGADGSEVTLRGPIAVKYAGATAAQRTALGVVLTGDHNAGTRESGLIYQQFKGGVITAANADAGTPAYITWGRIRDAWNIERGPDGTPAQDGKNGSAGPLGAVTSDETAVGALKQTTFEHGKITFDPQTGKVQVTVNGKIVPAGL